MRTPVRDSRSKRCASERGASARALALLLSGSVAVMPWPALASPWSTDQDAPDDPWNVELPVDDPLEPSPWLDESEEPPWFDESSPHVSDAIDTTPLELEETDDAASVRARLRREQERVRAQEKAPDDDGLDIDPLRRRVHLRIDVSGGRTVDLVEGGPTGEETHAVICESPCDERVSIDPKARYTVTGSLRVSKPFHIPVQNEVELRVRGGSFGVLLGGFMLGILGGGVAFGSVPVYASAKRADSDPDPDVTGTRQRRLAHGLLGAGIAAVVVGTIMVVGGRTRVRVR
jgi:hypothetical protein